VLDASGRVRTIFETEGRDFAELLAAAIDDATRPLAAASTATASTDATSR
jgi:hypothetical protein